jgi:hypothetical protein
MTSQAMAVCRTAAERMTAHVAIVKIFMIDPRAKKPQCLDGGIAALGKTI